MGLGSLQYNFHVFNLEYLEIWGKTFQPYADESFSIIITAIQFQCWCKRPLSFLESVILLLSVLTEHWAQLQVQLCCIVCLYHFVLKCVLILSCWHPVSYFLLTIPRFISNGPVVLTLSPLVSFPACGRRFYKSSSQDLQCSRCPTHSFSDREGSSRCECEDGYYRAPSDPPYVACTSKFKPGNEWLLFPFHSFAELSRASITMAGFKFETFSSSYL